jgi:hypothetical protein
MADLPTLSQDLSDLADVVLTKLRESDGANPCPIVIIYAKRGFHPIPNTSTRLQRVRVDGQELWRLLGMVGPGSLERRSEREALPSELPAVKSARTAIRLALGRAYHTCGTSCGAFEVKMIVQTGSTQALPFHALVSNEDGRLTLAHELEMVRILQEMELVRMVPFGP